MSVSAAPHRCSSRLGDTVLGANIEASTDTKGTATTQAGEELLSEVGPRLASSGGDAAGGVAVPIRGNPTLRVRGTSVGAEHFVVNEGYQVKTKFD